MPPFIYRCPNTGRHVQGFTAEEVSGEDTYETVTCAMCQQVHLACRPHRSSRGCELPKLPVCRIDSLAFYTVNSSVRRCVA